MSAIDFQELGKAALLKFPYDWQRESITLAICGWADQQALINEAPKVRDLKKSRWPKIRDHAQSLADLLADDPVPLIEYTLFSDSGEERIGRDRLRVELHSLAGRARALIAAKSEKDETPEYATNLALAREAVGIFYSSRESEGIHGKSSLIYTKGTGYYGPLFDFTCEMFAAAARAAPNSPKTPKRGGIAKFIQVAIREEKSVWKRSSCK